MFKKLQEEILKAFGPRTDESAEEVEEVEDDTQPLAEYMENKNLVEKLLSKADRIRIDPRLLNGQGREMFLKLIDFKMRLHSLTLTLEDKDGIEITGTLEDFHEIRYTVLGDDEDENPQLKVWFYRKNPLGNFRLYIPCKQSDVR
jgi:hypothetical protein